MSAEAATLAEGGGGAVALALMALPISFVASNIARLMPSMASMLLTQHVQCIAAASALSTMMG